MSQQKVSSRNFLYETKKKRKKNSNSSKNSCSMIGLIFLDCFVPCHTDRNGPIFHRFIKVQSLHAWLHVGVLMVIPNSCLRIGYDCYRYQSTQCTVCSLCMQLLHKQEGASSVFTILSIFTSIIISPICHSEYYL